MESGVKDTAAYRIVRQVTDHTWGSDAKLDDAEVLRILDGFQARGGSWERLMAGDMKCVKALEESIDSFMNIRNVIRAASVISGLEPRSR